VRSRSEKISVPAWAVLGFLVGGESDDMMDAIVIGQGVFLIQKNN
jgi:hypothetical protein